MDSEVPAAPTLNNGGLKADAALSGSHPRKKNQRKAPKRIHKAEREKMKREHLNELFLALANTLELTQQNSGKASILCEATRNLKDMVAHIEGLKKENAALSSESQYVTIEKNELQDENTALEIQIGELQSELKERFAQSKFDLNVTAPDSQQPALTSVFWEDSFRSQAHEPAVQHAPIVNPYFVIPMHSDFQVHSGPGTAPLGAKPVSNVSKPQARYPTPADSWPSQLLEKQPESAKELQLSRSHSSACSGRE